MAAKKTTKKAAPTTSTGTVPGADGKLTRAIWHKGKMYNPKNKADVAAFGKLIASDKKAAEGAQKIANKKAGVAQPASATEESAVGGGVTATEEPEA